MSESLASLKKPSDVSVKLLSIALLYEHRDAGTWSLLDLSEHRGVIAPEDLDPDAFVGVSGSMRMYSERFKCFLQTGAAGDLVSYVNFLIESLVPLDSTLAGMFTSISAGEPFFDFRDVVAGLFQENQTMIILQSFGDSLQLSYLDPKQGAPEHRLSPYFCNVRVEKEEWRQAAVEALDEYFRVAEERLHYGIGVELKALVSSWRGYRNACVGR